MSNPDRNNDLIPVTQARTSKIRIEKVQDEITGEFVYRAYSDRNKFGPEEQIKFCEEYAKHGRMGDAAQAAGVGVATVRRLLKNDPDFAVMAAEAEEAYSSRLLEHHQNLIFEGVETRRYDRKTGELIEVKKEYPIRLIELELKAKREEYRDKREVKMEHSGGVLVAPAEMKTIDDWEAQFGQVEDAEVLEDEDD